MFENFRKNKAYRILNMYERLNRGEKLKKIKIMSEFEINEKTFQRDIKELREYLKEVHLMDYDLSVKYDKKDDSYHLEKLSREWFTNEEVLAISKIILESRAFTKDEMEQIINKITNQLNDNDKKLTKNIIEKEKFHYIPPRHNKKVLNSIWELSYFINKEEIISISYTRKDGTFKNHRIKPVAIMFSEYYFYLVAFMADEDKGAMTIFRIDRIADFKGTKEKFRVNYADKFNDGEFRKRVQFMFSGALKTVEFEYIGESLEAVLDRLPTAEVIKSENGVHRIKVEVYGDGIDMWIRSQGDRVRLIFPKLQ